MNGLSSTTPQGRYVCDGYGSDLSSDCRSESDAPLASSTLSVDLKHPDNHDMLHQSIVLMAGVDMPAEDLADSILAERPDVSGGDVRDQLVLLVEEVRRLREELDTRGLASEKQAADSFGLGSDEWVLVDDSAIDYKAPPAPSALWTAYTTTRSAFRGACWLGSTAARWAPTMVTTYNVATVAIKVANSGNPLLALLVNGLSRGVGYALT